MPNLHSNKCFLTSLILFGYSLGLVGQTHMVSDKSRWYYNQQLALGFPAHNYYLYEILRDTVIGSDTAKLIQKTYYSYPENSEVQGFEILLEKDQRVFHYEDSSYRLMYDFSLAVSDTFRAEVINESCDSVSPIILDSIGIQKTGNVDIKSFYLSYTLYLKDEFGGMDEKRIDVIRERIGYKYQFIYQPSCLVLDQFTDNSLRCYTDPEIGIYKGYYWSYYHPNKSCDSTVYGTTQIEILEAEDSGIKLFPNPVNDLLIVELDHMLQCRVEIFDISGTKLKNITMNRRQSIHVGDLEQGIYIVRFYQLDSVQTRKIFVSR